MRRRSNAEEDASTERGVLGTVLDAYPELFTERELVLMLVDNPGNFAQRDAVERAVRDLARVGLLHCPGGLVMPTRAALHFNRLGSS
jgi:hypothetical protein